MFTARPPHPRAVLSRLGHVSVSGLRRGDRLGLPEVAHDLPDGRVVDDRGFALTPTRTAYMYGDNTGNHTVITL